ncbi:MAG: peptidoglycan-associated lipoprotein Pal [Gemmatimonadetes bacterium]|uniref:Peptidoglycan-associated lipoprotein n=1 Tax=Candidatus Kutchimonas denitrificans TaxID=3056748 RepID=A0AAE4Z839_9BACT|nr:peptidoglycan-associated lipoprotein Pal [Gemmatimonadota bacterium]NIR73911.1 peptidoglycan-associated lipoprotein Pal [Candidatus Kutchimonas denitrificans]NIR99717.1 peptidoglycan-associated lipoprotein Pal [Gemmatimonadota bacterium]NIT65302.1 peptidoglycan-associated lipoprotein Pal [Gemmatimonadota bacterium]NIW73751.1 peptidoglycan-associated lipoprotein Pal [Gemmatimonadota bacterium]
MSTWKNSFVQLGSFALILVVIGCGGGAPEPQPEPEPEPQMTEPTVDEEAERARMEEERRRREEEERRRMEAARERVMTVLAERVHFDFDKSEIRPDAEEVLQRKVTVLREYPGIELRIAGHCDERGSNEYNLALGQRRAEAVKRYLVSYGLSAGRFTTISYGEERPLDRGQNEDAWAMNRRGEFTLTDQGRLGGM